MKTASITATLLLAIAAIPAQSVGTEAPEITWAKTYQFADIQNQKLSDLRGSVVVMLFWTEASTMSIGEIPKLNGLFAEKAEDGLVVIGVTGDDERFIPRYLERNKVKYPIARAEQPEYRIVALPDAIVVDQAGKIAWRGHPAAMEKGMIEKLLVGAKPAVVCAGLEEVQAARRIGKFGDAWKKAKELLGGETLSPHARTQATGWVAQYEAFVTETLARTEKAAADGDAYTAWLGLDKIHSCYAGLPGSKEADDRLAALLADTKAKREIEAGKLLADARAKEASFDFDDALALYQDLKRKWSGTRGAKTAVAAMQEIERDKIGYDKNCHYCKIAGKTCATHKKKKR